MEVGKHYNNRRAKPRKHQLLSRKQNPVRACMNCVLLLAAAGLAWHVLGAVNFRQLRRSAKDRTKLNSLFKADTGKQKKKVVKICLARALERRSHVTWDYLFPRKFYKTKCCEFALFYGVIVWKHIKCLVLKGFWLIGRKYFFQILTVQIKTKNSIKFFKWAKQIEKLHAFINFTLFNFPSDYNRIILWPKKSFYVIESHIGSIQFLLHHFTIEKHITDLLIKCTFFFK